MPPPPQPLRTALIGLSSTATTSWASAAHLPGLLTPLGQQKFTITALLNSSIPAAKSAIQKFNLPPTTKAYGNPDDLANDPDIDLVIVNTRVDRHYESAIPSVRRGKDVYLEWPIGANEDEVKGFVEESGKSGARVAVGLQRRWNPAVVELRKIVEGGRLGKVLGCSVVAFGGTVMRDSVPAGLKYFTERGVGGNVVTIGVGHLVDFVQAVVGEIVVGEGTGEARLEKLRGKVGVRGEGEKVVEWVESGVPDFVSLQGRLVSEYAAENSVVNFQFRQGPSFPGTPALEWRIHFEKGEMRLLSPGGLNLQKSQDGEPVTIQLHDFETNKVEDVEWDHTPEQKEVPLAAREVMRSLFAFADGEKEEDGWVGIEDAARRARQIEGWLKQAGW